MSDKTKESNQVDIIKIIQELNKCNFNNFELTYNKLHIKINSEQKQIVVNPAIVEKQELPQANLEALDFMKREEELSFEERIANRDEEFLSELDYEPELVVKLMKENKIQVNGNDQYEYVEDFNA